MSYVKSKFKPTFVIFLIFAIFVTVNFASPISEQIDSTLRKRQATTPAAPAAPAAPASPAPAPKASPATSPSTGTNQGKASDTSNQGKASATSGATPSDTSNSKGSSTSPSATPNTNSNGPGASSPGNETPGTGGAGGTGGTGSSSSTATPTASSTPSAGSGGTTGTATGGGTTGATTGGTAGTTTGATPGSGATNGTPAGSGATNGTPAGSGATNGTPAGSGATNGTPAGSGGATGTNTTTPDNGKAVPPQVASESSTATPQPSATSSSNGSKPNQAKPFSTSISDIGIIPTIDPTATCASPNDARCTGPPGNPPILQTSTQDQIQTITPPPASNGKNTPAKYTTLTTTVTLYFAGYTTTISTTDAQGQPTTYATYVPPSTVLVVKKVAVTAPALEDSSSDSIIHDLNGHGLWGVTLSLVIVTATLMFMILA